MDVLSRGMIGKTSHRHITPGCKRDIEQPCRLLCVIEKHFVEITHAEKKYLVTMA
jgi:hypothetical protein